MSSGGVKALIKTGSSKVLSVQRTKNQCKINGKQYQSPKDLR